MSQAEHTAQRSTPRGVTHAAWEDELRAGQEADGGAGSVDAELSVVHVLRHVRAPEELPEPRLDAIWSQLELELAPARPWWRAGWVRWAVPVAAAAALIVILLPPRTPPGGRGEDGNVEGVVARSDAARAGEATDKAAAAPADEASAPDAVAQVASETPGMARRSAQAEALERQFASLAPATHRQVGGAVDGGRGRVRGELLALAKASAAHDGAARSRPPADVAGGAGRSNTSRSSSSKSGASGAAKSDASEADRPQGEPK